MRLTFLIFNRRFAILSKILVNAMHSGRPDDYQDLNIATEANAVSVRRRIIIYTRCGKASQIFRPFFVCLCRLSQSSEIAFRSYYL